ncbi:MULTISPECIES: flagellar hook capping FlgD N-terminal domain-containing protein [Butyrivibrio]|jgi:flagellar basal-body rod modification protein FlgD|uniref:flagellar hook capping FlgD N-terminal domain-containing protein n=1 Tax=Butyrivibrio TaxID=830 RepID=UPI0003FF8A99|nr:MULTISPECIES: flagellar hook capping FlgD N-terminal domain-containing protein [Butyrivibrio]
MADVNSVTAIVKDGKIENASNKTESKEKNTQAKGYDKDSFLKILVAQMKYQDPMEPTSNTEYISQYATFTQVEQMNNMANAMSLSRASEMVGKTVTITQTNPETGTKSEVQGVVDFVTYSGNKAFLNINGTNYNVDDVTQILGEDYENALNTVKDFQENIDKLPDNISLVTLEEHEKTIDSMYDYYMNMDEKAKRLMDKDYVTSLLQYVNRIDDLNNSEHRTFNKDK